MPPTQPRDYTAHFISHTHWDREWYGSFQQFRFRFVRLVEKLLKLLDEDPEFRYFHLDGQTIVLEDLEEARPDLRAPLEARIREGRVLIGPWYILPDEWLVSGEAHVRNLLRGRRLCRDYGVEPPAVGYLPDMFGHISQMPQILRGFGMDNTIMWRGLSGEEWMTELHWESPDGSRVLAVHIPEYCGYCNAAFFYGGLPAEARNHPDNPPAFALMTHDIAFCARSLRAVADRAIAKSRSGHLLFMNGVDHMDPQPEVPEILKRANAALDDVKIVHARMSDFMDAVRAAVPADLQTARGELRSTGVARETGGIVLPNILSSRIYLKLANTRCEKLLEQWAEPFASAGAVLGYAYPEGLIQTAWKYLLQNHPHDSIGGCSVDQVHRDMEYRFDQCEDLATVLTTQALYRIAMETDTNGLAEGELALHVFNPLGWPVSGTVTLDVPIEIEWLRKQGLEIHPDNIHRTVRNLRFTTWDGAPVGHEVLDVRYAWEHRPWVDFFASTYEIARFRVALAVEGLPPVGRAAFRIALPKKYRRLDHRAALAAPNILENEHLRAEVQPNGTLRVSGPATGGAVLEGLHFFEDDGDNGDGYTYSPPRHNRTVTTLGGACQIERLTAGPALQSLAVEYRLDVPESLDESRQRRAGSSAPLRIRSVFSLGAGSRRIDVETTVTNTVKDHRLRVAFAVRDAGETHAAEMPFDVVERPNRVPQPPEEVWIEDMPIEQPQKDFVTAGRLAVANFGLPEYEVAPGDPAVLRLTLLRAVNYLGAGHHPNTIVGGAGPHIETPDAQMLGRAFTFRYALIPHGGDFRAAGVQRLAHEHNAGFRCLVDTAHAGSLAPAPWSLLHLEGPNILLSTLKRCDDDSTAFVLRFYNSGDAPANAVITWMRPPSRVWHSNLAELPLEDAPAGPVLTIPTPAKRIHTVRFIP